MKNSKNQYSEPSELKCNPVVSPYGHPEYAMLKGLKTYHQVILQEENIHIPGDLFDVVFGVDPRTKLPSGDLAMFMGDNVSPEVRDFISKNLMKPFDSNESGGKYDGLNDDDISLYTRGHDESLESYRSRMYDIVKSQSEARRASKFQSET